MTSEKKEGSPGNPSFSHSLTFLLPLSLFFFLSSIFLLLLQSLVIRLVNELHGRRRDLYMMIFFSWCLCISSFFSSFHFFSSSFFHFSLKLARHHCGPLPRHHHYRHPCGGLASRCHAPMELGRHATLRGGFSY
ncbi:hypothetical protein AAZX31_11G198600 [Glycine max]